jgi:hypothetical protein
MKKGWMQLLDMNIKRDRRLAPHKEERMNSRSKEREEEETVYIGKNKPSQEIVSEQEAEREDDDLTSTDVAGPTEGGAIRGGEGGGSGARERVDSSPDNSRGSV